MQCKVVTSKDEYLECINLGRHHYNEVERRFTGLPYEPKYALFTQLFEEGHMSCVALLDGGDVVGYVLVSISPSLFSNSLQAQEIGVYVDSKYRGQGWFKQMLELTESELSKRGVTALMLAFKSGLSHKLPEGYVEAETFHIKKLEA
jgi:ribosomal protein S18 acetylase RimI-like enzyme